MAIFKILVTSTFLVAILCALNFQSINSTALIEAVERRDYNRVKLLLQSGVNINDHDNLYGRTALMWAANQYDLKMVELLLGYNPDLAVLGYDGKSATVLADPDSAIVDLLQSKMTVPTRSCFLTFEQDDYNGKIWLETQKALLNKIMVIISPYILKRTIGGLVRGLVSTYCRTGKFAVFVKNPTSALSTKPKLIIIIPESLENLKIVIPKSEKQKEEPSVDLSFVKNEYGFENITLINPAFVMSVAEKAQPIGENGFNELLEDFSNIIDTNSLSYPNRFFLIGHGEPGVQIASIPLGSVKFALSAFCRTSAEFVYIDSCYLGGTNLQTMQTIISEIMMNQIQQKAPCKTGINYGIVIQATSGVETVGEGNLRAMFKKLDDFLKDPVWALEFGPGVEKPNVTISDAVSALDIRETEALPSIRLPGKTGFFRSINIGNMEIITTSSLIDKGVKRILELVAESKSSDKSIADEAKRKLKGNLDIEISTKPDVQLIQIFPMDLLDFNFSVVGMTKFISKLTGNGQHFIGKITFASSAHNIQNRPAYLTDVKTARQVFSKCFINVFEAIIRVEEVKHCWFINSITIITSEGTVLQLKKVAIKVDSMGHLQSGSYAYINEKGEYIISNEELQEFKKDKETYESTIRKWFQETIPSQETLRESIGSAAVTAEEKTLLEKTVSGAQALQLLKRFARTPQDLFDMFMAQRKAAFLPIADITDQWKTYLDTAKTQKDKLEVAKKDARSSIEPLQKAVVAANVQDAMAAFNKIGKWLRTLDQLHTTIIDIEGRMQHDAAWLNAIALKPPAIETLEKETIGIESYSENANATAVELMKGQDKVKDRALKNAQALADKITEAEHKNTKDVGIFERKYQAETSEAMRQELTKREAERRAKADEAIKQMTEEAHQWREISGIPRLP